MSKKPAPITLRDRTMQIQPRKVFGDWAVHRSLYGTWDMNNGQWRPDRDSRRWEITHIPTGLSVVLVQLVSNADEIARAFDATAPDGLTRDEARAKIPRQLIAWARGAAWATERVLPYDGGCPKSRKTINPIAVETFWREMGRG